MDVTYHLAGEVRPGEWRCPGETKIGGHSIGAHSEASEAGGKGHIVEVYFTPGDDAPCCMQDGLVCAFSDSRARPLRTWLP